MAHVETRHGASLVGLNVNRFVLSEQYWQLMEIPCTPQFRLNSEIQRTVRRCWENVPFEAALAPVSSLDEAINYWRYFKSYTLLPVVKNNNLKMLGYGNQPISGQFFGGLMADFSGDLEFTPISTSPMLD
ncbi:MAG: hypothetical protein NHB32_30390 [Fischerella sp. CENA71]|nr:hypothetical protein [Fischerella sp. CENA71]